jgi:hypothetical protein
VATGVVLPNGQNGTVNPASFTIAGQANYTFSITLPSGNHQIDRNGGVGFMNVTLFTHNLGTTPTLSNTGTQTLLVGATLNVGANQPAGDYKSATPFNVSIVYN